MPVGPVSINDGSPSPNPAPVSKSGSNNQSTQLKFQSADNTTYTLTGLDACLSAPSSVTVSPGHPAGPYSPLASVRTGAFGYGISPSSPEADPAEIMVNP